MRELMNKNVIVMLLWIAFVFVDYFYINYFIRPFFWIFVWLTLFILLVKSIRKVMRERNLFQINSIVRLSILSLLFFLTIYRFNKIPHAMIEKIDWTLSYHTRDKIVKDVLAGRLKPNGKYNNGICKLPFGFPLISNSGNEIWIIKGEAPEKTTVKFWISRGFFESPQSYFVFTNDNKTKKQYNE
jgi:hypothetical protein